MVTEPPRALESLEAESNRADTAVSMPVWQALLDIQIWRTHPWWIRVVAKLVVKRLNR
jgi:hypothetical protein